MSLSCVSTGPPLCYTKCSDGVSQITPIYSSGTDLTFLNSAGLPTTGFLYIGNIYNSAFLLEGNGEQVYFNSNGNIIQFGEPQSNVFTSTGNSMFVNSDSTNNEIVSYGDTITIYIDAGGFFGSPQPIAVCAVNSNFTVPSTCTSGTPIQQFQIVPSCGSSYQIGDPVDMSESFLLMTTDNQNVLDSIIMNDSNGNSVNALAMVQANTSTDDLVCNYPIGSTLTCSGNCLSCQQGSNGGGGGGSYASAIIIAVIIIIALLIIFIL